MWSPGSGGGGGAGGSFLGELWGAGPGSGAGGRRAARLREVEERVLAARRGLAHDGEDLARLLQPPLLDAHGAQPVCGVDVVGLVLQHRAVHLRRLVEPRLLALPGTAGGLHVLDVLDVGEADLRVGVALARLVRLALGEHVPEGRVRRHPLAPRHLQCAEGAPRVGRGGVDLERALEPAHRLGGVAVCARALGEAQEAVEVGGVLAQQRLVPLRRDKPLAALLGQPREVEVDRRAPRVLRAALLAALLAALRGGGGGGGERVAVGLLGGGELAQLVAQHADVVPQLEGHAPLRALEQAGGGLVGLEGGGRVARLVQLGHLQPRAHVVGRELGGAAEVLQREHALARLRVEVAEHAQGLDALGRVLERALEVEHGLVVVVVAHVHLAEAEERHRVLGPLLARLRVPLQRGGVVALRVEGACHVVARLRPDGRRGGGEVGALGEGLRLGVLGLVEVVVGQLVERRRVPRLQVIGALEQRQRLGHVVLVEPDHRQRGERLHVVLL